ncbi:MAG: hypothetical protein LBJ00_03120 [Planctomycetaceae bacterium]|nr:hypothetical protein [Planctomycetaceae bacterium]
MGYLNFSSGNKDAKLYSAINTVYKTLAPNITSQPQTDENNINQPVILASVIDTNGADKQVKTKKNTKKTNANKNQPPIIPLATQTITLLQTKLAEIAQANKSFRIDDQAGQTLDITLKHFIPKYRQFHEDILFHQIDDILFNPFALAKIFESIIRQGSPWEEVDRIVDGAIDELNDYIGYRPIAILEGVERHDPNKHEFVATVPLYIKKVGIAHGKYKDVVEQAVNILNQTDPQILDEACFSLDKLDEIVLDPRAYDFDHPVNRKPNYHFGVWDPYVIDSDGYYRRFVVHQVTLDGILKRVETAYLGESEEAIVPPDELLYEAGAVLAGTMLMGSGVCGDSPNTYSSETALGNLMSSIANYRDKFYEQLMDKTPPKMKERLKQEESRLYQPFGSCRQNLNKQLAKKRADQLQRMNLSRMFARMGYFEAAKKQSDIISVASTRILTQIDCTITEINNLIDHDEFQKAFELIPRIEDLLRRGIACGAVVDPWTILGFGANYSLFHSVENSIHDHRVDDLINIVEDIFDIYSSLQKSAAAVGNSEMQADLSDRMSDLAGWWDKYGSTTVSGLDSFSGADTWESTVIVSNALSVWYKAGTAAGDVAFWNKHVSRFNSTKAYVLVTVALLEQNDPVASMALMMHWLDNSEKIPLSQGDYSFHIIATRWMEQLWNDPADEGEREVASSDLPNPPKNSSRENNTDATETNSTQAVSKSSKLDTQSQQKETVVQGQNIPSASDSVSQMPLSERWKLTKKFFDFTEANADRYLIVPKLELSDDNKKNNKSGKKPKPKLPQDDFNYNDLYNNDGEVAEADNQKFGTNKDSIYSAAYDNVVYQDTADDGVDGSMMELPSAGGFDDLDDVPLVSETERISERLTFIITMSRLWKFVTEKVAGHYATQINNNTAAAKSATKNNPNNTNEIDQTDFDFDDVTSYLVNWMRQIEKYERGLDLLLREVSTYVVPPPRGTSDSLLEYDRHRGTKEILLERIIWTNVDLCDAKMILKSFLGSQYWDDMSEQWQAAVLNVNHAIFLGNIKEVKRCWEHTLKMLSAETILYVPTSRGGAAWDIVRCRSIQHSIMRLMQYAPRLGLIIETFKLLDTVKIMEEVNTIKPGAITEFDRLVETATRAITQCIAVSSRKWKAKTHERWSPSDHVLVEYMERTVEVLLASWLSHSRQIRISPVESIVDRSQWDKIKTFIQRYGKDIFTQQNMGFGNLRAILHQGIENFLSSLVRIKQNDGEIEMCGILVEDLINKKIDWNAAISQLEIVLESIAENYSEYIDYNSTTTHSDHGDKLYMLLDMLRVQIGYERISWNLKPVYWVHDAMIRSGCEQAGHLWERAVARRSMNAAEEHLRQYNRLSEKYGMWLPSVHERLQERFIRPLQIDRMCGLVSKAIAQAKENVPKTAFKELYEQIENFAKDPLGVGFEMPEWLTALQDEIMSTRTDETGDNNTKDRDAFSITPHFDQVIVTRAQLEKILDTLDKRIHF